VNDLRITKGPTASLAVGPFVASRVSRSVFSVVGVNRTRILAASRNVAIDQLDDRHRRGVRSADAGLDHAGVTTGAVSIALCQHVEQLHQLGIVEQACVGQTAVGKATMLGQRDQLFNIGAQFARLGQRGR
jgi:hypothetical protein